MTTPSVREAARALNKAERSELSTLGWATYWFNGYAPRRSNKALRSLIAKGLAADVGPVTLCDGDGFAEWSSRGEEIIRTGYNLTDAGIEACEDWREKIKTNGRGPR